MTEFQNYPEFTSSRVAIAYSKEAIGSPNSLEDTSKEQRQETGSEQNQFSNICSKEDTDTETETLPDSPIPRSKLYRTVPLPIKTRSTPKLTLVLDLDETLVHCNFRPIPNPDQIVTLYSNGQIVHGYVKYRPFLKTFLEKAAQLFELVVFTASEQGYADQILNKIDPFRSFFRYRYYRQDCTFLKGNFIKDLRVLGRDLRQVVIVDNSVQAFSLQLANGIPISSWIDNENDQELASLFAIVTRIQLASDVRPYLCNMFKLTKFSN